MLCQSVYKCIDQCTRLIIAIANVYRFKPNIRFIHNDDSELKNVDNKHLRQHLENLRAYYRFLSFTIERYREFYNITELRSIADIEPYIAAHTIR